MVGESAEAFAFVIRLADPAMLLQIDLPGLEDDSFFFEQSLLSLIAAIVFGEGDPSFSIDNPMPGKAHPGGRAAKGVSNAASLSEEAAHSCDLSVGGHLAAWDVAHGGPDFGVAGRM